MYVYIHIYFVCIIRIDLWNQSVFREISNFIRSTKTSTNFWKNTYSQVIMLHSQNSENSVPEIVEVESYLSTSTLTERMFEEDSDTSSEESVGNRREEILRK